LTGDFDLTSALDFLGCESGYVCQMPFSVLGICLFCHFKNTTEIVKIKTTEMSVSTPTGDISRGLLLTNY
jgi:hypothetical protein